MISLLVVFALEVALFDSAPAQSSSAQTSLKVTSPAFFEGGKIPKKYTCDDSNVSLPLHIDGAPSATKSLALVVDDPDAPGRTWTHWLVWNIDPKTKDIRENSVPGNAIQGTTDFGNTKYGGPCPPSGVHRYFFHVYALDTTLSLPASANRKAIEKGIAGHIIANGSLMGTYSREH